MRSLSRSPVSFPAAVLSAVLACMPVAAAPPSSPALDLAKLPPASVEIDLTQSAIQQALGVARSALAGFVSGVQENATTSSPDAARFVTEQAASIQHLTDVVDDVIQGVQVKVWKDQDNLEQVATGLTSQVEQQLAPLGWTPVVVAREHGKVVRVYTHSVDGAVRGGLVIAHADRELVLASASGSLTNENVERLTKAATKVAFEMGLERELQKAFDRAQAMRQR